MYRYTNEFVDAVDSTTTQLPALPGDRLRLFQEPIVRVILIGHK